MRRIAPLALALALALGAAEGTPVGGRVVVVENGSFVSAEDGRQLVFHGTALDHNFNAP